MGKPVFKRAKHGIHFKNNDGSITANFSGKPCHYLDGAVWRAIDTRLIRLSDGWYGSPHSDVRIHPDGRVKVEGYQQRAELPSAKVGKADNDKLIREFSFGSQELRITEDGFRSEITLNRIPTLAEARKLIASESGTLSKKYLKSLTTATDANGDVHVVTTLAAFRKWLAKAVFPVVIDPDFSTTSDADTGFYSGVPLRNYGAALAIFPGYKMLFRFDLSSITSGSTCSAATIKITTPDTQTRTGTPTISYYKISDANGDWIEGTGIPDTAKTGEPCWSYKAYDATNPISWAGSAGLSTAGTDYINTVLGSVTFPYTCNPGDSYTATFNADGRTVLQSWFGVISNNGLVAIVTSGVGGWTQQVCMSEHATEAYRPVLTVTYTAGGGIIPIVQYYNRLRRN
jgi:hypothetical protein